MEEQIRLAQILDKFFDSAAVEEEYYNLTKITVAGNNLTVFQWHNDYIQSVINDLKSNPTETGRKYDVIQENGIDTLILKRRYKAKLNTYRKIMSLEQSFGLIAPVHREVHHQGYKQIYERLRENWSFPATFVSALVSACNVCKMLSNTTIENDFEYLTVRSWRVKFICMETECHYILKPKFILVCEDIESEFLILRPLNEKSIAVVSETLAKVFLIYGPPNKMLATIEVKKILDPALKTINKLHPSFVVSTYFDSRIAIKNSDIIGALKHWIEMVEDSIYEIDCEIGCHVVQRTLNTRLRMKETESAKYTAFIPHNRFMKQRLNGDSWDGEVMIKDGKKFQEKPEEKEKEDLSDTEVKEEVVEIDSSDTEVMKVEVEEDPLEMREIKKDVAQDELKSIKREIKSEPDASTVKRVKK